MAKHTQTLFRGGRLLDPEGRLDTTADLLMDGDRIVEIGRIDPPPGCQVVEADGLAIAPGLVDMHVHLREPGYEYKETIAGGTAAAAAGGVTSIAAMANTKPVADDPAVIRYILETARREGKVNVFPIAAITKGLDGRTLTEMGLLRAAGCVAFSDDGKGVADSGVMRRALDYSRVFDGLIIQHAEDAELVGHGCVNEGVVSTRLGLPGIPAVSEEVMVDRDIHLVRLTGGRYHVAHLSTAGAARAVAKARQEGLPVTAEVAPHHFALTEEAVGEYDTDAKMAPPLRSASDRNALLEALSRGGIEAIATDHAPHEEESKKVPFREAANGVVGLETLLPVSLELYRDGVLPLLDVLALLTFRPARLLGIDRGRLAVGAMADVVLFDLEEEWVVDRNLFHGKGRNTCFHGRKVRGRVKGTWVAGKRVFGE